MKILEVNSLALSGLRVVKFGRFADSRGYFTEHFRASDFKALSQALDVERLDFLQSNESRSVARVVRGLHFQWNPFMGKLVRTLAGHMVDMALDIRKDSPTLGKVILYDMPADPTADWDQWIWLPPGFAHGNYFTEPSAIEYFCTAEYSPGCEAGISPLASDLDWSLADPVLKKTFDSLVDPVISEKDQKGLSLHDWLGDPKSEMFRSERLVY